MSDRFDADLVAASKEAMNTGCLTPLLKKELWLKIQSRRLAEGKEELIVPPTPSPSFQISQAERVKKQRRQEQNRRAAKRFRSKEKGRRLQLLTRIEDLEASNAELEEARVSLISLKNQILVQLCQHLKECRDCPAPPLQNTVTSLATADVTAPPVENRVISLPRGATSLDLRVPEAHEGHAARHGPQEARGLGLAPLPGKIILSQSKGTASPSPPPASSAISQSKAAPSQGDCDISVLESLASKTTPPQGNDSSLITEIPPSHNEQTSLFSSFLDQQMVLSSETSKGISADGQNSEERQGFFQISPADYLLETPHGENIQLIRITGGKIIPLKRDNNSETNTEEATADNTFNTVASVTQSSGVQNTNQLNLTAPSPELSGEHTVHLFKPTAPSAQLSEGPSGAKLVKTGSNTFEIVNSWAEFTAADASQYCPKFQMSCTDQALPKPATMSSTSFTTYRINPTSPIVPSTQLSGGYNGVNLVAKLVNDKAVSSAAPTSSLKRRSQVEEINRFVDSKRSRQSGTKVKPGRTKDKLLSQSATVTRSTLQASNILNSQKNYDTFSVQRTTNSNKTNAKENLANSVALHPPLSMGEEAGGAHESVSTWTSSDVSEQTRDYNRENFVNGSEPSNAQNDTRYDEDFQKFLLSCFNTMDSEKNTHTDNTPAQRKDKQGSSQEVVFLTSLELRFLNSSHTSCPEDQGNLQGAGPGSEFQQKQNCNLASLELRISTPPESCCAENEQDRSGSDWKIPQSLNLLSVETKCLLKLLQGGGDLDSEQNVADIVNTQTFPLFLLSGMFAEQGGEGSATSEDATAKDSDDGDFYLLPVVRTGGVEGQGQQRDPHSVLLLPSQDDSQPAQTKDSPSPDSAK